ncbi:phosphopantetheine-containing protein [Dickeya fangzhongdai]|uniref:Acyl carrier protein n=2 Tax=Pectobacteriaceae TaxID=1903410 RepID=A0A3N0G8X0_9GAMM|nr:phosphopantetheine-containing protein [Dickeya fangzhongdai]KGT99623.1 phosphopantetheine-containing protein [Dickeya fangzhongdai]KHN60899.1 phosphopantetheine-containing protein [Dickeya fangzhongdai]RNM08897.1 acyl carrier protein [Dickeya undicola]RNM20622.1 acyl carrier protein [Dickeya undicola]
MISKQETDMSALLITIQQALREVMENDDIKINEKTDFDHDLDLDSVMFVQFLLTLEDNIDGLLFDPDQINMDAFTTVGSLINWLNANVLQEVRHVS